MEKTTQFLRMLGAGLAALAAGLLVAQRIREATAAAEAEIRDEDRMSDAAAKLTRVMEQAAEQARKAQH